MFCCIIWKLSRYTLEFRAMNVMTCWNIFGLGPAPTFGMRFYFAGGLFAGFVLLEILAVGTSSMIAAWSPAQKLWNVKLDRDARSFAMFIYLSVVAAVTLMYVLHRWSSKLRLNTQRLNSLKNWDIATQQMPHVRLFQGFGDVLWFGAQFGPSRDLRMRLGTPAIWGPSHTPGAATGTSSHRTTGRSSPPKKSMPTNQSCMFFFMFFLMGKSMPTNQSCMFFFMFFLWVHWSGKCWKFNVEPDPSH